MALPQIRRLLPLLTAGVLIALLYDGWVFYSRWDRDRQAERERAEKSARQARRDLDAMGGTDLKIVNWYASPGEVRRGQATNLCYSVVGAKNVRMEPAVQELYPALSHCIQVSPRTNTEYKLFAADASGRTVTQSLTVTVLR